MLYLVPNLLVLIEALFRSISSTDTSTFIGPTWASVGIALILPLTRRQKMRHQPDVADEFYKQADDYGLDLVPKGENELIDLFIIVLFVAIALWVLSLYLSLKQANIIAFVVGPVDGLSQLRVPWYNVVGLGVLIAGIASTEYKERLKMTIPYEAIIGLLLSISAVRLVDIFVDYQKRRDAGKPRIIEARAPSGHVLTLEIPKDPSPQQKQELLALLNQFGQQEQKTKTSVGAH